MRGIWAIVILGLFCYVGCKSVSEAKRMANCTYEFHSVKNIVMAGVNVDDAEKLKDLKFSDLGKITQTYLTGTLPVRLTANISVTNPNKKTASVERLDWIMYVDDSELARGVLNDRFEITQGSTNILPIDISFDVMDLLKDESKKTMLNFAFNLAEVGGKPAKLKIKIRPSVRIGSTVLASPGYFTVNHKIGEE